MNHFSLRCFIISLSYLAISAVVIPLTGLQWTPAIAQENTNESQNDESIMLLEQGFQQVDAGQPQRALVTFQEALAIFQDIGNRQGKAYALIGIGRAYRQLGNASLALPPYQEALPIFISIGDRAGERIALSGIGSVYNSLGQYEAAIAQYERALEISVDVGDRQDEGTTLNNIGTVYNALGQYGQSLSFLEQALTIRSEIDDTVGIAETLSNIAAVNINLSQYEQALALYEQVLTLRRRMGDRRGEAITLNGMGAAYVNLGQLEQSLTIHEQALAIRRAVGDRYGEAVSLNNIGRVYFAQARYDDALDVLEQALTIRIDIGDRPGQGTTLSDVGVVNANLGQYQRALDFYDQALAIRRTIGDRRGEGITLNNIGVIYDTLGQYESAIDVYEQALVISREIGNRADEATALNNAGLVYARLRQHEQSLEFYQRSLALSQDIGDRITEGRSLNNIGYLYDTLAEYDQALEFYGKALTIRTDVGDRRGRAITLNNIGFIFDAIGESELAIIFFKLSIDQWEAIRNDVSTLNIEQQQSFQNRISISYRRLADLLLQFDRILEAQEITDLLKLQEIEDYNIQTVSNIMDAQQVEFWAAEQEIIAVFNQLLTEESSLDIDRFTDHPQVRLNIEQLRRNAQGQTLNPEQLIRLQDNLQQTENAAILYPLILNDRLELILITPSSSIRITVPVDQLMLNETVSNFRQDITNPFNRSLRNAQQLHEWLIAPITDELEIANIETVFYAADGVLRYIPLAALHDGDQWLTQQFTINHITAASLTDFSPSEATDLSVLAGAFPSENLEVNLGNQSVVFNGLPYAQAEVQNLADSITNSIILFGAEFSQSALEAQLNRYNIVHLATHAEFHSGHPNDSFILLGDGDRITLSDLNQWRLPNVDLVVLSACKTAVSGQLGNGEEILGFGYQMQRTGADAAIASLWYVSDGGTQLLMDAFYTALQNGYAESEALRRAQIALITDDETVLDRDVPTARLSEYETEREQQSLLDMPNFDHPYYWAPFILIGNGV
jgi:CHAT domain-containing protein/Flp pilus assembly protein TadD